MIEKAYRTSRVLLAMGEPIKYQIVRKLEKEKKTPGELAKELHRSTATISYHLSILKKLDIVRYNTEKGNVKYWLKYPEIGELLNHAERCTSKMKLKDYRFR